MALSPVGTGGRLAQLVSCFIPCALSSLLSSSQQQEPRGLSQGVLLNSDHPSLVWLPGSLEGAGGGGHPTCPVGPKPSRAEKASPGRGAGASLQSLLPVGAASRAGTVPPRARQALSATMGMAEAFQSPSARFNCCCVLLLTAPAHCSLTASFECLPALFRSGAEGWGGGV